jgi:hypothetical protein
MNGAQLLEAYNKLSPTKRKAKFTNKEEAIKRIKPLLKTPEKPAAKKAATAKKTKAPSSSEDAVIRIKSDGNPRRDGTDAHLHFKAMMGGITVGKYLAKFEDRKKAKQWLWNTVRDGHVELLG